MKIIKRILNWQVVLGLALIAMSAIFYIAHYIIFRDAHHIFIYLIGDIAFVFIEVLLVTIVLHRILAIREKKVLLTKLNMVIGAFFSEVGTELMSRLSGFDKNSRGVCEKLLISVDWGDAKFNRLRKELKRYDPDIDPLAGSLDELKKLLAGKREFLLALLENPNLLEHESFTNLLWAVFHLTDELCHRNTLIGLPEKDMVHLAGDIKRSQHYIVSEWIDYMHHLKNHYPYLFSLAMRTNPFDAHASVVIVK